MIIMHLKSYPAILKRLNHHIKPFLDASSHDTLHQVADNFIEKEEKRKIIWHIKISKQYPLLFSTTKDLNFPLQVDLSCNIKGEFNKQDSTNKVEKHNAIISVWSMDKKLSYRKKIDAKNIKKPLENSDWRRVILRFHIDKKSPNNNFEPLYHLHFGGKCKNDEFCWFPEKVSEPRFRFFPMDVVLLCEFILTNFFPKESLDLRAKREWITLVRKCQEAYLESYINQCRRFLNNNDNTFLGFLIKNKELYK